MTLAASPSYLGFVATAGQTVFPVPFRVFAATDLEVYLNEVLITGWSLSGVGSATCTLTMAIPLTAGDRVRVRRVTLREQLLDYRPNDPFGAESHEAGLDRLTAMIQDLLEEFSRRPALGLGVASPLRHLALPAPGAGNLIGWNANGTQLVLYPLPGGVSAPPQVLLPDLILTDFPGVVGDGLTDCSAGVQAACNLAALSQRRLVVPAVTVGYKLNTTINLTNLKFGFTMVGQGIQAPTYGAALVRMAGGSVFLGNTGTGNAVFDCAGSSNLLFDGINITSLGMATPSTVGFLFATSTTAHAMQAPGGANCSLENVAIQLQNANNSCPVYYAGGSGLSHFTNVWTLGVYGIYITANNELALTSDYVTLGPIIGIDGITGMGCNLLGYGGGPVLVLEIAHNQQWLQTYMATIFGGPGYVGQAYAMKIENCLDVYVKVEVDYFPTVLIMEGDCRNVTLEGTTFPNTTPLGVGVGIIAYFAGTVLRNCNFNLIPHLVAGPINNYHYTSNGITPTMTAFQSCRFAFDTQSSTFVSFLNVTAAVGVPYFNVWFDGDSDTGTFSTLINGVSAGNAAKRTFINGIKFGTA
jgi:hypothetical protein